jgi:dUTP pyrophosphatase
MATVKRIEIKFKKLRPDAKPPVSSEGNAGWDFYAPEDTTVHARQAGRSVGTGIALEIPEGYYMELFMRSSYGKKTGLRLSNQVGVIDRNYRGEIIALFDNIGNSDYTIKKGERFVQGIIKKDVPVVFKEAQTLSETNRGVGGFGSTGK